MYKRQAYERFKPEAIFIGTSCATGIIGEDIESVANIKEKEYGIPILSLIHI